MWAGQSLDTTAHSGRSTGFRRQFGGLFGGGTAALNEQCDTTFQALDEI